MSMKQRKNDGSLQMLSMSLFAQKLVKFHSHGLSQTCILGDLQLLRIAPWCSATKEHEAGNVFGAEANILSVIDVATLPLSIANFLLQGF